MSKTDSKTLHKELYSLLLHIYNSDEVNEDSYDYDSYKYLVNKLVYCLSSDINITISFFESLNLNDEIHVHIFIFVDEIREKLKIQEDKEKFTNLLNTLNEKFSDSKYINWGFFKFKIFLKDLSELSSNFNGESDSEEDCEK